MKVLIIDDSEYKIDDLLEVVNKVLPGSQLSVARSFQSGLRKISEVEPDLVLLDVTLPTSERDNKKLDGRMRLFGGRELMAEMDLENVDTKVVIVTQFDSFLCHPKSITLVELLDSLKQLFPKLYFGGVHYSIISGTWREDLEQILKQLLKS